MVKLSCARGSGLGACLPYCCLVPQLGKTVAAAEELAAANKMIVKLQQELREVKKSGGGSESRVRAFRAR